jgi:catechol 2,3-dioxygenase
MEPQAALQCLHLYSPDPLQAARFYSSAYGMAMAPAAGGYLCRGPGRELRLSAGPANQLHYAHYALADAGAWRAFAARLRGLAHEAPPADFAGGEAIA